MEFFVDSNIIIEGLKVNGLKEGKYLLSYVLKDLKNYYFFNEVVYSEVKYNFLFKSKKIKDHTIVDIILDSFLFKPITLTILKISDKLIESYNLKPHDALILATCKHYNIKHLISLDEDFKEPCEKEGIVLINSVGKLKEVLKV